MTDLLRSHFAEEAGAGFPRLSRIPSTAIVRFLDYHQSLGPAGRETLLDALARRAAHRYQPPQPLASDLEFEKFSAAMQSARFSMGLRYQDVKMTKAVLGDAETMAELMQYRATFDWQPRDDLASALVPNSDIHHLHPAKAPLLRKTVDAAFKNLFASDVSKVAGGEMRYRGRFGGLEVIVSVDFGSRLAQLRYAVSTPDPRRRVFLSRVAYEDLWVTNLGWDYLTEENAADSIHLLCQLIASLVGLANRV